MINKQPDSTSKPVLTRLPEANEFSPGQVDLKQLLAAIAENEADREMIMDSIREQFFKNAAAQREDPIERRVQQRTRAYNALLGASKYGLVGPDLTTLTSLGTELLAAEDEDGMYRLFARHIIRELGGFEVLVSIREMQAAGLAVNKSSLQAYLEQHGGFQLPRATTHHMKLLQWLRKAGVLPAKGYEISEETLEQISGLSINEAETWVALTTEQKAFLHVLRRIALLEGSSDVPAKMVVDAVITEYGPIFERPDQLAASVFKPLADPAFGWITHKVVKSGRGGKSGSVAATQKLLDTEIDLLPEGGGLGIPPDLRTKLQTPLDEVYGDLESPDTYTKGIALELLALRMAIDLTLVPVRLRERGITTGGAEVDLVAEAAHLHFSRWVIQCKNTNKVGVSALAKEVGMAVLLNAQVIMVVTTGEFSSAVSAYAKELAATGPLQALLVDGAILAAYRTGGAAVLRKRIANATRQTMAIKQSQLVSSVSGA